MRNYFEPDFRFKFDKNIHIRLVSSRFFNCILLDDGEIYIGDDVLFGPCAGNHAIISCDHPEERMTGSYSKKVVIEDNVWIGANVTFGKNTIIGSGSVVTKNIPENVIAVVNPWSVLREIAEEDKVISL